MTSGSYAHCRIFSPTSTISLSPRAPFLAPPRQMWLRQATHFVCCWFFFFMNSSLSRNSQLEALAGGRFIRDLLSSQQSVAAIHAFCASSEFTMFGWWFFSHLSPSDLFIISFFSFSFSFPSLADTLDQHVKTLELLPWLLGQKLPGNPTSVIPETKQMTSPVSSKILPLYEQEAVEGLTVQVTDEFSLNSDQAR